MPTVANECARNVSSVRSASYGRAGEQRGGMGLYAPSARADDSVGVSLGGEVPARDVRLRARVNGLLRMCACSTVEPPGCPWD